MNYPSGAITTVNMLLAFGPCTLYGASRVHTRHEPHPIDFIGEVGVSTKYGSRYEYFRVGLGELERKSLLDYHVRPQTYNDLFLFANLVDAQTYLA